MKTRVLFAWLLCATCLPAQAQTKEQEYHPFAEEGKNWMTKVGGEYYNQFYGYFIGDTIIEGKVWQKVYTEQIRHGLKPAYYAAVRDEGKKVYAIAKGSSRPRLLYDFSLKEWDIVRCGVEGSAFGCLREKDEPMDSLLECVHRLKQEDSTAVVIVSLHWGAEHTLQPVPRQRMEAHQLIVAGADILVCHHTHTLQTIEDFRGHKIYYSIGNFIFDQPKPINSRACLVRLKISKDGFTVETIPISSSVLRE